MSLPDQIVYATQDVGNRRHCKGDPNVVGVYGEPGWTCQDWTNGALYVCTLAGVSGWVRLAAVGGAALTGLFNPDFGIVAPQSAIDVLVALPGAVANDSLALGLPAAIPVHAFFDARVVAPGQLALRCVNYDGGNLNVGVRTIRATVLR